MYARLPTENSFCPGNGKEFPSENYFAVCQDGHLSPSSPESWGGPGSAPVAHQVGAGHSRGPWVGPQADPRPAACGALSYRGSWRQWADPDPATGRLWSAQGLRGRGPETPELKFPFFLGVLHGLCCSAPPWESPVHLEVLTTSSQVFFRSPVVSGLC